MLHSRCFRERGVKCVGRFEPQVVPGYTASRSGFLGLAENLKEVQNEMPTERVALSDLLRKAWVGQTEFLRIALEELLRDLMEADVDTQMPFALTIAGRAGSARVARAIGRGRLGPRASPPRTGLPRPRRPAGSTERCRPIRHAPSSFHKSSGWGMLITSSPGGALFLGGSWTPAHMLDEKERLTWAQPLYPSRTAHVAGVPSPTARATAHSVADV